MEGAQVVADALERIKGTLERAVTGLPNDDLHRQPRDDCNSIAWLAWHLTRVQDDHLSNLAGREQAWTADGWHARFGMEADPHNLGGGHTPEQVAAFRAPDTQTLLDYHNAVLERSKAYLETLATADLDRVLDEPQWQTPVTVGVRLVSVINDNTQHAGQIAYLRGLFQGLGWQRF